MAEKRVILDSDFLQGILDKTDVDFFKQFMHELDAEPCLCWYVAKSELFSHKEAQRLMSSGDIKVINPEDFLKSDDDKMLFESNVKQMFEDINSRDITWEKSIYDEDFHLSALNLGEIISELMAKEMKLPLFASNDKGSKKYAKMINSAKYRLEVRNVAELIEMVGKNGSSLKWTDIKHVLGEERWKQDLMRIRPLWVKDNS